MSYLEALLIILRRWRISGPALVLALGAGAGTFIVVPPGYQDTVQVLLLGSPDQAGVKTPSNPYLSLSSTLVSTGDVIRLKVSTAQTTQRLAEQGARAEYEVVLDQSTTAPVLLVTAKDSDPAVARETSTAVVKEIQRVLTSLQRKAGAPRATWVTSTVISSLPKPERKLNESLRPALVVGVGLCLVAILVVLLLEGHHQRIRGDDEPASVELPWEATGPPLQPRRLLTMSEIGGREM